MTITWRKLIADDAEQWLDLRADAEAVDKTGEHTGPEQFAELMADPTTGTVGGFDGDLLVAEGVAWFKTGKTEVNGVPLDGHVRPSHRRRGIGRELLDRLVLVAEELHAVHCPHLRLEPRSSSHEGNPGHTALLVNAGYVPVRWFFDMRAELDGQTPDLPFPPGLTVERYTPAIDDELRRTHNDCFAEHWGNTPSDPAYWTAHYTGNPAYAPDRTVVLRDDATGEIAAYVMGYDSPAHTAATGLRDLWLGQVGTRKAWRGRGVATALLAQVLRESRAAGYDTVTLAVDTGNSTGALGVYERCGFSVVERWTTYALIR
ncbi:Ribosomal protein S18 acetylase RimI [Actinokineospora alba]|uniref:Ribosomal protein S18 acetylase RimI n=1 Tax=Actinokineospora alba TaxID=504798 RepID=A0A1H0ICE3_9PSEU|nr:GNAT family N-acetyltransferase [Actinokineospora alba]TDP70999.1 ribosomal protein S18 acetylase RimI-like enzyme [Actinokineospora alba]SDI88317.1 Ribosomal protein S18 acetylase RimI [Actinokineospora alba]SDO29107.1 Ribosomal protein S18 acetylase RimI [Actinokineospora alba]